MSVYTSITPAELKKLLGLYQIGALVEYRGIDNGVANSNFFVTTTMGEYVLTLFESMEMPQLTFSLGLMSFLSRDTQTIACPIVDSFGVTLAELNGKPSTIVERLPGASVDVASIAQCQQLGKVVGELHRKGRAYTGQIENSHGAQWRHDIAIKVRSHLSDNDQALLQTEIEFQKLYRLNELPRGVIHADLFRDNVLFQGDEVSAVLDWYNACDDAMLYDLAVIANDWCCDQDGKLIEDKTRALLTAYHQQRPLIDVERSAWPVLLRSAALRFWLSRMHDRYFPRAGELTQQKDPDVYKNILQDRINSHDEFYYCWIE